MLRANVSNHRNAKYLHYGDLIQISVKCILGFKARLLKKKEKKNEYLSCSPVVYCSPHCEARRSCGLMAKV